MRLRRNLDGLMVLAFWVAALVLFAAPVLAQDGTAPAPAVDWKQAVAIAVNSVGVVVLVQLIKAFAPALPAPAKVGIALAAGPLLMLAQTALAGWLGYPVDLQPIAEALKGLASSVPPMIAFAVAKREARRAQPPFLRGGRR